MKNQENQSVEQMQFFEDDHTDVNPDLPEVEETDGSDTSVQTKTSEESDTINRVVEDIDQNQPDVNAASTISIKPLEEFQKKQEEEKNSQNKKNKESKKETNFLIELLDVIRSVAVCFFLSWLVATYVAKPIRIDGTSMYPTLHHADYGFSNIIGLKFGEMKRFEVVVVYEPWLDDFVIKRIIGLPNETISYRENQLYINGEVVEELFFDEEYRTMMMTNTNAYFTNDFDEITLGDDEYFIMGDNRPKSSDSREYGPIKKDQIISKGALILFPFQNIGLH